MARRAVIDREELFETANTMLAAGKDVTALALLTALGGGSLTTIYKYLAEWEAGRPKVVPANAGSEIPDVVLNAFASAWRVATMEAAKEVAAVKEKAAEDVRAAQKQFEGALEAIQKLEGESEQDAVQIETLKVRVVELEASLMSAHSDVAAFKATAEQLRQQVRSQQTELDRVHRGIEEDRQRHKVEVERLHEERAAAQQKAEKESEQLHGSLADAQKRVELAERDRTELQVKLEQSDKQAIEVSNKLKATEQKLEETVKEAAEFKGQAQMLKAQNAELMTKFTEVSGAPKKSKPET